MLDRLNRHNRSDEEWLRPRPPADPPRGGRWDDYWTVINGIFFRTWAGCPWRDLPEGFGNWRTVYNRHRRWSLDGTWEQILDGLRAGCDEAEGKGWTVSADSTVNRAHQHAGPGPAEVTAAFSVAMGAVKPPSDCATSTTLPRPPRALANRSAY